jgi:hypothetical protein
MSSKLIDRYIEIQKIGTEIEVPFEVKRVIGGHRMSIMGEQVSIGSDDCDFVSVSEAREALEWYVNQLGGKVKWSKI